jgi:hypothetical protein
LGITTIEKGAKRVPEWLRTISPTACSVVLFILAALYLNWFPKFFYGGDFYLFHHAEIYRPDEAIFQFFLENGRFFEGLYWIYLYKLIGYQPVVAHIFSLLLNFLGASLALIVLTKAMPKSAQTRPILLAFATSIFFFPHVMQWAHALPGDNSRISVIMFFTSVLFLQIWAQRQFRLPWLLISLVTFAAACFTYENIVLLFPAGILLSLPLISKEKVSKARIGQLVLLGISSLFFVLLPFRVYEYVGSFMQGFSHPVVASPVMEEMPSRLLEAPFFVGNFFLNIESDLVTINKAGGRVLLLCLTAILILVGYRLARNASLPRLSPDDMSIQKDFVFIFLAGLWIVFMGLLPFAIGRPNLLPGVKFFSASVYGMSLIFTLGLVLYAKSPIRYLFAAGWILVVSLGILEFGYISRLYAQVEFSPKNDQLSIATIAPNVKEGTSFIFVDNQLGDRAWDGCALALRMLYDKAGIRCLFLSTFDENYTGVRSEDGLFSTEGGLISDENWIIIGMTEDGERYVIPQLDKSDGVLITWLIDDPILTDYRRISETPTSSQMFRRLAERKLDFEENGR